MHTHNTLMAPIRPWAERLGLGGDTVVHMGSTFGHLTGFLYGAWLPTHLAATGVYQDVWDAGRFAESARGSGEHRLSRDRRRHKTTNGEPGERSGRNG
jgi:hypothetical protein